MPEPLHHVKSYAAPIPVDNIDTDVIMPKRFLRTINREGLAAGALADLRFHQDGSINTEFILNQAPYTQTSILVVGDNFGCGSSREHAVWGLYQLGVRAIIGTTYGGIFFDNCRRNGLAAISLASNRRNKIMDTIAQADHAELHISIEEKRIIGHEIDMTFDMPHEIQHDLMQGVDVIATTLQSADAIRDFEQQYTA